MKLFRKKDKTEITASLIYQQIVSQSRNEKFYLHCGVADTVDGRFDMVTLHVVLVLLRIKQGGGDIRSGIGQALFDRMFHDMDQNLREMGIGDIGVSHRIKGMVAAFYGRMQAYETGLSEGAGALEEGLRRNLYRKSEPSNEQVALMADYVVGAHAGLAGLSEDDLNAGKVEFGQPPGEKGA